MSDIAIRVHNLSKQYTITALRYRHDSIRDQVMDALKSVFRRNGQPGSGTDTIWALKDVSFDVKRGEVLGIIGRNGAGKSTLLKILSRITGPSYGRAEIFGRVGSLLEVGTGFDRELTGLENIYLNGAILGMKKAEIDAKLDEIVSFSEVEKFIDTPVKRYSSGMYVRLAFAVAAHLEQEILIIDEVLAVGDLAFQTKCLLKMREVIKEGRTILFVSHNVGMIAELCRRTLLLEDGQLRLDALSTDVIAKYLVPMEKGVGYWTAHVPQGGSGRRAWLKHARVFSRNGGNLTTLFPYGEEIKVEIGYEIQSSVSLFRSYFSLRDSRRTVIFASHDTDGTDMLNHSRKPGAYHSICVIPQRLLRPGWYHLTIGITAHAPEAFEEEHHDILSFEISNVDYPFNLDPRHGLLTPYLTWSVVHQSLSDGT